MHYQNNRNTKAELRMLGFVAPDLHSQPSPDTATNSRHPQEHTLRNSPARPLRLPLVNAVQEKRDDVDNHEVKDYDGF